MNVVKHESYVATKLYDDIWSIDQGFVRGYLVIGSKRAMMVDTCNSNDDISGLVRMLTSLPVIVVQTHCDHDHIGGSLQFETIYMHPSEFALLRASTVIPLVPLAIREGERIDLGSYCFEVVLIPGHTPGSIALLDRKARILFSGDSIKEDIVYMFGPGRDLTAYMDSLKRLYSMRHSYDKILPNHGVTPITSDYIPALIEGAKRLYSGELNGIDDGSGLPCKLYIYQTAKFYY